jgi:hypothetical protein
MLLKLRIYCYKMSSATPKTWNNPKPAIWLTKYYQEKKEEHKSQLKQEITIQNFLTQEPDQYLHQLYYQQAQSFSRPHPKNITVVENALMILGREFVLSFDINPTDEEIELQIKTNIIVFYYNDWRKFFNYLDINILKNFVRQEQNSDDIILLDIIAKMCTYNFVYNKNTIGTIICKYNKYLRNKSHLPKIIIIEGTQALPGISIPNCVNHLKSKLQKQNIKSNKLLHLFRGIDSGISSETLCNIIDNFTCDDRLQISINLKGWIKQNPGKLPKALEIVPKYPSICVCSNCNFMISDSRIEEFIEGEHISSFRMKDNPEIIFTKKPNVKNLLYLAQNFLYIQCTSCTKQIHISNLITKYTQAINKVIEFEKIKLKTNLYKICVKLVELTLLKQFPEGECILCAEILPYDKLHKLDSCKHDPCICLKCNDIKLENGKPVRGNIIRNSNSQCLSCTAFEPTYYNILNEFNSEGGVLPGYVGRFCYECCSPFQQKPETCGVEVSDISLHCVECTISLAEYNKKIRLVVICPNEQCKNPTSRYYGCDVVTCLKCNIQFCYGCEYIFTNPPDFEWGWECTCLNMYSNPKQYNDKSQSQCEDKYINYQYGRGVIIERQEVPIPEQEVEPEPIQAPNPGLIPMEEIVQDQNHEEDILLQISLALQFDDDFSHLG